MNKRGIALDKTPQKTRQSSLVEVCPDGVDFVDYALSLLNSDWVTAAESAFERYRTELPMKTITERPLDERLIGLNYSNQGVTKSGLNRLIAKSESLVCELRPIITWQGSVFFVDPETGELSLDFSNVSSASGP
jgi:hypothetical protein